MWQWYITYTSTNVIVNIIKYNFYNIKLVLYAMSYCSSYFICSFLGDGILGRSGIKVCPFAILAVVNHKRNQNMAKKSVFPYRSFAWDISGHRWAGCRPADTRTCTSMILAACKLLPSRTVYRSMIRFDGHGSLEKKSTVIHTKRQLNHRANYMVKLWSKAT